MSAKIFRIYGHYNPYGKSHPGNTDNEFEIQQIFFSYTTDVSIGEQDLPIAKNMFVAELAGFEPPIIADADTMKHGWGADGVSIKLMHQDTTGVQINLPEAYQRQ